MTIRYENILGALAALILGSTVLAAATAPALAPIAPQNIVSVA